MVAPSISLWSIRGFVSLTNTLRELVKADLFVYIPH